MSELNQPIYAALLIDEVRRIHNLNQPKPHAFDTPFRHSAGGDCALKLGMQYSGIPDSDPFDEPSMWATWLGTMVHEHWQEACAKVLTCEPEVRVHDSEMLASGSLDLLHELNTHSDIPHDRLAGAIGGSITVEAKLVNGTKFMYAAGVYKRGPASKWMKAKGPASGHVIQLALNTMAAGSDWGVLFYLSSEAVSKGVQKAINRNCERQMTDMDRFILEWTFTREELAPIAERELVRLGQIRDLADQGTLPEPTAIGDDFKEILLDPTADPLPWQCEYCSHFSVCPVANGDQPTEKWM